MDLSKILWRSSEKEREWEVSEGKTNYKESDKQWQMLQSDIGSLVQVPGMVKGEGRLQWAGDRIRDEMVRAEAGDERMDLFRAVTEECLNKDSRLNLSVDGVKSRRRREKMDLGIQMKIWLQSIVEEKGKE